MPENAIEIKNLKKSYQGKFALRGINFSVQKGTIHGFVGPNGAGKTTTIKILRGGMRPDQGKIYLAGKEKIKDRYANRKISFMVEKFEFANDLTVEEFIYLSGQQRKLPFQQVKNCLRKSDLYNHRQKKCSELSIGWGKILLYFVAVIHEPDILVLDEPTSGLDPSHQRILLKKLAQFRQRGGTVLISSHILSDLQKLVDSVTLINKGEIIYTGKKPVDFEKMYYEKVFLKERIAEKEEQT